jgi:hypothetical protein
MNSQIFKIPIDKIIFYEFLSTCSEKKLKYYEISKISFKSAVFQNLIQPFCDSIKDYYHISKQHYITRKMTYKNLITVIRQICKFHHIAFTSQIKYDNSNYEISYSIFADSEQ